MGSQDLGLRGDDWYVTPFEFEALLKRRRLLNREALRGSAMICSLLANINRDSKKREEPFTTDDFLPVDEEQQKVDPVVETQNLNDQWRIAWAKYQVMFSKKGERN